MFDEIAIVGVGMIGGSLAAAVRERSIAKRVLGIGRNRERLQGAQAAGLLDRCSTDPKAVTDAELIVVCTPVNRIANDVRGLWDSVRSGGLVTDAGSTKAEICSALADCVESGREFVGSHPIAGSHRHGFEAANPKLFKGKLCIVTPLVNASDQSVSKIKTFWEALGMRSLVLQPEQHDQALAATSHLPHLAAAALAGTLEEANDQFIGAGFLDSTRIAAGDPELWTAIFLANRTELLKQLGELRSQLELFDTALQEKNSRLLKKILGIAKENRVRINKYSKKKPASKIRWTGSASRRPSLKPGSRPTSAE